ncbi:MAG: hypothetical protein IPI90_10590 [Saprospiraceae bacterium]|nr:hypothetical protein [Candidatus Vicinibacter affinis]
MHRKDAGRGTDEGNSGIVGFGEKIPDYLPLQITLSQLAVQTGQWEKAKKRQERYWKRSRSREANCLMVEVIAGGQLSEDAGPFRKICEAK